MMRIGIWAAVSSKPQADADKESLPSQIAAGESFAAEQGGEVVATYRVPGHSRDYIFFADAADQMPAYAQLHRDVDAGRLDVLWALDADRLGRDPALVQQVISLVEKAGGEVFLANSPHVLGSKTVGHRYVSAIQAIRAGEEQAIRVARHRMGMKGRIIRKGLHPGLWPLGYEPQRNGSGEVTGAEFTDDIEIMRLITRWFLDGVSYKAITRRLAKRGIPSPRGSRVWSHSVVRGLLQNDIYAGFPSWGPWRAEEKSDRYPSLWDGDTYRAVLRERRRRDVASTVKANSSLYTGVLFCIRCNGPLVRNTVGRYNYWRCSRRCHWNGIREDRITRVLRDWLIQPEQIERSLAEISDGPDLHDIREEIDDIAQRIKRLVTERQRLTDAVASGAMDAQMYREADDMRLAHINYARAHIAELERQAEAVPDLDERREQLEALAWSFPILVLEFPPAEVARMLVAAHVRVWVEEGEIQRITTG